MTTAAERSLDEQPEAVRARVVALAAEVLPDVPKLPPAVRRVAAFAPARRARLGGGAIAEALTDDELRRRVGTQLAARPAPDRPDPASRAARAWLVRPDGWEEAFEEASGELAERPERAAADDRELERLRGRLADAEQALRDARAGHRAQVEELKAENTALRRKLGDSRAAEREARAAEAEALETARASRSDAEERCAALEKDNRRLRGQVERFEAEATRVRRDARSDRDEATVRARLLLDTVIDAATGLRRELGLPAVEGAPADRVESALTGPGAAGGGAAPAGSTAPVGAAGLEQLLAMPRARLVVDGYNVSKTAWPSSSLEAQRIRLVNALAPLVARTRAETTVVFDAAETDHRPPVNAPRGVKVLFSPRGVIADDVIRDLVAAEPPGRVVLVVTRDRAVAQDVVRAGARAVDPVALLDLLTT